MIASQLTDAATLVTAMAALVSAFGASIAAVLGKRNKVKIEDGVSKVEEVHEEVVNNKHG